MSAYFLIPSAATRRCLLPLKRRRRRGNLSRRYLSGGGITRLKFMPAARRWNKYLKMASRHIGYIGLGKMGVGMALRLREHGFKVAAFNRGEDGRKQARKKGLKVADSLEELVNALPKPRVLWLMVSSAGVDETLDKLIPLLSRDDTVIDGGNCFYEDTMRRANVLKRKGIHMLDAGVSGGPSGDRKSTRLNS